MYYNAGQTGNPIQSSRVERITNAPGVVQEVVSRSPLRGKGKVESDDFLTPSMIPGAAIREGGVSESSPSLANDYSIVFPDGSKAFIPSRFADELTLEYEEYLGPTKYSFVRGLTEENVKAVKHVRSGEIFAQKQILSLRNADKDRWIKREILTSIGVNHRNLVKTFAAFNVGKVYYLIQELAEKDLHTLFLEKFLDNRPATHDFYFDEKFIRESFKQIVVGVQELHKNRIIHRDIKPENILIFEDGTLKIADFGHSVSMGASITRTPGRGTERYQAPEMRNKNGLYDERVDLYSLGSLLYSFAFNSPLPMTEEECGFALELQALANRSPELFDLIAKLTESDPEKRLRNCQEILNHPWMRGQCIRDVI